MLTKDDKRWVKAAITEGVVEALKEVVIPQMASLYDAVGENREAIEDLNIKIDGVDRKLIVITDNLAVKFDDQEKRIEGLERAVVVVG